MPEAGHGVGVLGEGEGVPEGGGPGRYGCCGGEGGLRGGGGGRERGVGCGWRWRRLC